MKEMREKKEMDECTFKPKIIDKKKMSGFSYNERN
jgi:hypothetical protein